MVLLHMLKLVMANSIRGKGHLKVLIQCLGSLSLRYKVMSLRVVIFLLGVPNVGETMLVIT